MSNIAELDREMNALLLEGKVMDAFEKFTTDDVVMTEPGNAPFKGKEVNRKRELAFFDMVEAFHSSELLGASVGDGVSFSEWRSTITFKGASEPTVMEQVERRLWRDGKVYDVRFYYNAPSEG